MPSSPSMGFSNQPIEDNPPTSTYYRQPSSTPPAVQPPPVKTEEKPPPPPPLPPKVQKKFDQLAEKLGKAIGKSGPDGPNVGNILWRVIDNLTKMTQLVQRFAMTEADELNYLTQMQKMYTDLISGVRLYDTNNLPPGAGAKDKDLATKIQNANQAKTLLIDGIRSLRDMIAEDAKRKQAQINTSDDAQKSLLDYMQNLLQKWREWVQQVFPR